jgi:hypothetical protein
VRHVQLLAEHGMSHLDMHEITTRRRIVTQTIATDAFDNLDAVAIRFVSSRDGQACIVLFEGRAELEASGDFIALTDPAPARCWIGQRLGSISWPTQLARPFRPCALP